MAVPLPSGESTEEKEDQEGGERSANVGTPAALDQCASWRRWRLAGGGWFADEKDEDEDEDEGVAAASRGSSQVG